MNRADSQAQRKRLKTFIISRALIIFLLQKCTIFQNIIFCIFFFLLEKESER